MIERTFSVSESPDLEVRIPSGRVEIVQGEPGTVKVSVDTNDPDFTVEQHGDLIVASSAREGGGWNPKSAHVTIEAPAHSCAELSTASANISVRVPLRKAVIKTASGNVTLESVESAVIKTASGNSTVGTVKKALRFNSASGDIEVSGHLGGSGVLITVSGDVDVEDSDATLEIKTVSGNTTVERYDGKGVSYRTVSGDLEVGVPPGTKLHLEADTRSGRVYLPTDPPTVTEKRREMTIKGKLVSGNVTIKRAPE